MGLLFFLVDIPYGQVARGQYNVLHCIAWHASYCLAGLSCTLCHVGPSFLRDRGCCVPVPVSVVYEAVHLSAYMHPMAAPDVRLHDRGACIS
jgi:hypothetical protein